MRSEPTVAVLSLLLISLSLSAADQPTPLVHDSFDQPNAAWKEVSLDARKQMKTSIEDGSMTIEDGGLSGLYHNKAFSGHFVAELKFTEDRNVGLALIHEKDGRPDAENYTLLTVDTNKERQVVVRVRDCQNGKRNILDNTGRLLERLKRPGREQRSIDMQVDGYEHVLTGEKYSVPFDRTGGRIRVFRDAGGGFFHYYYAVKKTIRDTEAEGWMELAPSRDWAKADQRFFVAAIALDERKAVFDRAQVVPKPKRDRDDRKTGFKVSRREYNWSGFFGPAVVVSFDRAFTYHDRDIKFVFWSESNFVPAWHLSNQLQFAYEFIETWDGGNPGCHEPMSDRLNRWSRVEIVEDNPVRKVIHWHYVLVDPDYRVPDNDRGKQLPEVDEYWTFYPDGSGIRYLAYTPKLDTDYRKTHELGELISIAGSRANSREFFASPALTLCNLEGKVRHGHPGPDFDYGSPLDEWKQVIMAANFRDLPGPFCAVSTDPRYPDTYSDHRIRFQNTWHSTDGMHSHWPVCRRPYHSAFGSNGLWKGEITHACLMSFGVHDDDSTTWKDHFKTDRRGRKYRDWISLIGLGERGDLKTMRRNTKSWLNPGVVTSPDRSLKLIRNDRRHKCIVLEKTTEGSACTFSIKPASSWVNPVVRVDRWGKKKAESITLDGKELDRNRYRQHLTASGELLLWIEMTIEQSTQIVISQ